MWAWAVIYVLSTIVPLRLLILHFEDKMQRAKDAGDRKYEFKDTLKGTRELCTKWHNFPGPFFAVVFGTLLWPLLATLGLYWWLAFPKGRKTKYQKEKEREQALRERERLVKEQERQVLEWLPGSTPAEIEAGKPVTLADIEDQIGRIQKMLVSRSAQT